jgi:hypothetical protein
LINFAAWCTLESLLPLRLYQISSSTPLTIGAVFSGATVLSMLTYLLIPHLHRRCSFRTLTSGGIVLMACAFMVLSTTDHIGVVVASVSLVGASHTLLNCASVTALGNRASSQDAAGRPCQPCQRVDLLSTYALYNVSSTLGILLTSGALTLLLPSHQSAHPSHYAITMVGVALILLCTLIWSRYY